MLSPYGMEIVESCITCKLRTDRIFCDLPETALQAFEAIKYATAYPQGAVLFVEGQLPRGIFVLCKGSVKLSINSPSGRTVIVRSEAIKYATAYPQGAVLFVEGQLPRGIFVLCKGSVKLSINSPSGRTVIV